VAVGVVGEAGSVVDYWLAPIYRFTAVAIMVLGALNSADHEPQFMIGEIVGVNHLRKYFRHDWMLGYSPAALHTARPFRHLGAPRGATVPSE
jgi:hypothetical protein